jgi:hypothetical protein
VKGKSSNREAVDAKNEMQVFHNTGHIKKGVAPYAAPLFHIKPEHIQNTPRNPDKRDNSNRPIQPRLSYPKKPDTRTGRITEFHRLYHPTRENLVQSIHRTSRCPIKSIFPYTLTALNLTTPNPSTIIRAAHRVKGIGAGDK